jgi:hypothetical protein
MNNYKREKTILYFRIVPVYCLFKMFARFQSNYFAACQLKITSNICFSSALAEDVNHLALFYQMHNEAMVIALFNVAAVMYDNSQIYRANKFSIPMNLYNLVVARSCMINYNNIYLKLIFVF